MFRLPVLVALMGMANASFFRYGTISWVKGEGNRVTFTIETAWRRSYDGNYKAYHSAPDTTKTYSKSTGTGADGYPVTGDVVEVNGLEWPVFHAGDGFMSYLSVTVTAYSVEEDWFYGVTTIEHTYLTPSDKGSSWVAKFTGCCRLSAQECRFVLDPPSPEQNCQPYLRNNAARAWSVQAHVNLLTEEYSPVVRSLPVISIPEEKSEINKFFIPATNDNNERAIAWRLATNMEMGGTIANPATQPVGFSVARETGEVSYNTIGYEPGYYSCGLVAISGHAQTPVDFLVRVLVTADEGADYESIPIIVRSPEPYPAMATEFVGSEITFIVGARDEKKSGDRVGFTWGVLPDGARLSTVKGVNPVEQVFKWTPCNGQQGIHIMCFEAVDQSGTASIQRCIGAEVKTDPAPVFKPLQSQWSGYVGKELTFPVKANDENCKDKPQIDTDGCNPTCRPQNSPWPAGAELSPQVVVTEGACNLMQRQFSWTPRWDQGGWNGDICFKVTDLPGGCNDPSEVQKTRMCVKVNIARCQYTVQYEQQLQEIAAIYATDWINVWRHNLAIPHPDFVLYKDMQLHVGHVYSVNIRDNLHDIATRFGTSVEWLHHLNADLCLDHKVDVNQSLCIISDSCTGDVRSPYGKSGAKDNYWFARANDAIERKGETTVPASRGHSNA